MSDIIIKITKDAIESLLNTTDNKLNKTPTKHILEFKILPEDSQFDVYRHAHDISQIFRELGSYSIAVRTQLWCSGYYFSSEDFYLDNFYYINRTKYKCIAKSLAYIHLQEM